MKTVPLLYARINLHDLACLVERGETIVVTDRGEPVFDLVPCRKLKTAKKRKRK